VWENTVAIYSILKEKNYKEKFLTSSILKNKIKKDNFGENHNKNKKKHVEKHYSNQQRFKEKKYKTKFSIDFYL
jgi:hypothetical protein